MTVTFRLRPGLFWEDGRPVTAKDSVFAFQLASDAATPVSKFRINRTARYAAVDDLTIIWSGLPGWTDAAFLRNFWNPLPQHLLQGQSPGAIVTGSFSRQPQGYGPFLLKEWKVGAQLLLARHPKYFRAAEGLPKADGLEMHLLGNSDAVLKQLLAGRLDLALTGSLGMDQLADLAQANHDKRLVMSRTLGSGQFFLMLNVNPLPDRPAFFNFLPVRQAVAQAIDRARLVKEILQGSTLVGDTFIPPKHPLHTTDIPQYPFDQARAKKLLGNADWVPGTDGILTRGVQVFNVTLLFPSGRKDLARVADFIGSQLKAVGINVTPKSVAPTKLFAKGKETPLFGRNFDMVLFGCPGGVEPPAELFLCEEVSRDANGWGGPNFCGYCSDAFDKAALVAMNTPDPAKRQSLWGTTQRTFAAELPAVPLWQDVKLAAARPDFQGLSLDFSQPSEMWNVEEFF
jgi:peptide/nickel transport system substrate-binding protein